jgi:hypothetical protein
MQAPAGSHVGRAVRVWWPDDGVFYPARVLAHEPARGAKAHLLRYDEDALEEWCDLSKERVQWCAVRDSARAAAGAGGAGAAEAEQAQESAAAADGAAALLQAAGGLKIKIKLAGGGGGGDAH